MLFCQVARGNFNYRKRSIADLRRCLKGDEEGTGKGVFIIKIPVFLKRAGNFYDSQRSETKKREGKTRDVYLNNPKKTMTIFKIYL